MTMTPRHPEELSLCKPLDPEHLRMNYQVGLGGGADRGADGGGGGGGGDHNPSNDVWDIKLRCLYLKT